MNKSREVCPCCGAVMFWQEYEGKLMAVCTCCMFLKESDDFLL